MMIHEYIMLVPTAGIGSPDIENMFAAFEADGFSRELVMLTVEGIEHPLYRWQIIGKVQVPDA